MFKKTVLKNGVRILMEELDHTAIASAGIWIRTGSRDESRTTSGYAHFLEHLMFKGTKDKSAFQIARSIDDVGGTLNAFTNRENTCFYINVLSEYLEYGLKVLIDMISHSLMRAGDIEVEKSVISEEINMYDDSPEEYLQDLFIRNLYPKNTLGQPILGTAESVRHVNRNKLLRYYRRRYTSNNVVIAVAGRFTPRDVVNTVRKELIDIGNSTAPLPRRTPAPVYDLHFHHKKLSQVNYIMSTRGVSAADERRYTLLLLSSIVGGSMSSRLFQELRERLGLCYSIYTFLNSYEDCGIFGIYGATSRDNFLPSLEQAALEIKRLKHDYVDQEQLTMAKNQMRGNLGLALESTEYRMNRLAKMELVQGCFLSAEEVMKRIEAVSLDDIVDIVDSLFSRGKVSLSVLGNAEISTSQFDTIKETVL